MIEPRLNYVFLPRPLPPTPQEGAAAQQHRMAWWEWNATGNPITRMWWVRARPSRQGRDFDTPGAGAVPQGARGLPRCGGPGQSDWLADPMAYQLGQYAGDMLALLGHLHQQSPLQTLDWVGTSMGGLIGMAVCGQPGCRCLCRCAAWCSMTWDR